ncbi:MAG: cytidine deaminase, partial [Clostridia bacterium]|nr:cytidine deaminase [Clostridia bacterium]
DLTGCKIYVTLFPCNECAKAIIQSGIKEIYYLSDKYHDTPMQRVSRRLLDAAGVKYTELDLGKKQVLIDFDKDLV